MRVLPNTTLGLIEQLERDNPAICIKKGQTSEDANRYAGRVELIDELRLRFDAETKAQKGELEKVL